MNPQKKLQAHKPGRIKSFRITASVLLLGTSLLLSGCGGSDDDDNDPPNIAGVWAGTWEGIDNDFGPAAGTWRAELSQRDDGFSGPMLFGGDIDCAEGKMEGLADSEEETISGLVFRDPCPSNDWIFTAFNEAQVIASGTWVKQGLSNGSFEGRRIAKFTGPQIEYVYPPGGRADGLITIVGEQLTMNPTSDTLSLGSGGPVLTLESISDTVITARLPGSISAPDRLHLKNASGTALSPIAFNTAVTTPNTTNTQNIWLDTPGAGPRGIAFSVNGRRAFVANHDRGSVSMINTEIGQEWTSTVIISPGNFVHSLVAGPAGRRVYVAASGAIGVLHAHTLELLDTHTVPSGGATPNPQGIAVSPDGRWLLVSSSELGGPVTVLDLSRQFEVANTLVVPVDSRPRGIAVHPDGTRAFIAISGVSNEIWVYDFATGTVSETIVLGTSPASVAVTPNGKRLYVSNAPANTINYYDFDTTMSGEIDLGVGAEPDAIAISPDGFTLFASSGSTNIFLIDVLSNNVSPLDIGGSSQGIAVSPDGKRTYVSVAARNYIVEVGNQRTLRISKQGGGIGVVRSAGREIQCGSNCIANFDSGTLVHLEVESDPESSSIFNGWGGNPDCQDGTVSMDSNVFCVARFEIYHPSDDVDQGSGSGSEDCFIATAAYGSWLDPKVLVLREFRDDHLLTNTAGSWLVEFYYRHSPPIADYIREREGLRALVRSGLAVIVFAIEFPLTALTLLFAIVLGWKTYRRKTVTTVRTA